MMWIGNQPALGMIDNPGVNSLSEHYRRMRVYPRGLDMTLANAFAAMETIPNVDTTESTSLFDGGTDLSGTDKWVGGVLAPNGKIYGIPFYSTTVLCIDPSNNTVSTFGSLTGSGKWIGGVLAPNGKIYGIPLESTTVLCIDPSNNTISTFGSLSGSGKWYGGVLAPNGKIYGIPCNSTTVLCIDPSNNTISTFGSLSGTYKWYGGYLRLTVRFTGYLLTAQQFLHRSL
jgi:hypothetical protein